MLIHISSLRCGLKTNLTFSTIDDKFLDINKLSDDFPYVMGSRSAISIELMKHIHYLLSCGNSLSKTVAWANTCRTHRYAQLERLKLLRRSRDSGYCLKSYMMLHNMPSSNNVRLLWLRFSSPYEWYARRFMEMAPVTKSVHVDGTCKVTKFMVIPIILLTLYNYATDIYSMLLSVCITKTQKSSSVYLKQECWCLR